MGDDSPDDPPLRPGEAPRKKGIETRKFEVEELREHRRETEIAADLDAKRIAADLRREELRLEELRINAASASDAREDKTRAVDVLTRNVFLGLSALGTLGTSGGIVGVSIYYGRGIDGIIALAVVAIVGVAVFFGRGLKIRAFGVEATTGDSSPAGPAEPAPLAVPGSPPAGEPPSVPPGEGA